MINIFPLSEGAFTIDASKEFVPFEKGNDELNERPTGSLLVEIQPFLLKSGNNLSLFDTGLGKILSNGELQIHDNIRKCGFEPSSISHVILSHLHKDHAGGIGLESEGSRKPNFVNAKYFLHKKEWDYALEKGMPSYDPQDFSFLSNSGQLNFLESDAGTIPDMDRLEYKIVGGHCPYHLAFWLKDEEQIIFYGGDVAPQLGQMKRRVNAKYDFDGKKSLELREQWWERGKKEHWTFLFYHDIKTPVKVT